LKGVVQNFYNNMERRNQTYRVVVQMHSISQ